MSDIEALRKSLSLSAEGKSADEKRQMAVDAIAKVITALESGAGTFGPWEQHHLTIALSSLLAGKHEDARSLARRAIWPEENRRAAAGRGPRARREAMPTLPELKSGLEAAASMRLPGT